MQATTWENSYNSWEYCVASNATRSCGAHPPERLTAWVWYGLHFVLAAQGLILTLTWGTQLENFRLWLHLCIKETPAVPDGSHSRNRGTSIRSHHEAPVDGTRGQVSFKPTGELVRHHQSMQNDINVNQTRLETELEPREPTELRDDVSFSATPVIRTALPSISVSREEVELILISTGEREERRQYSFDELSTLSEERERGLSMDTSADQ